MASSTIAAILEHMTTGTALLTVLSASVLTVFAKCLYNITLHPLAAYPGPWLWGASRWPWLYHELKGDLHQVLSKMHRQYGQTLRIAPDELSCTQPGAWKTIYGHRAVEMEKNLKGLGLLPPLKDARSIVTADRHNHARMRKTVSHAFSEKALREQEDFLQSYVDELIQRLRDNSRIGPQNLVNWFNYTTFDVIGDMAFGEPFGCLKDSEYHPWVKNVFDGVKMIPWVHAFVYLNVSWLVLKLVPPSLRKAKEKSDADAYAKVDRRIARQHEYAQRRDFLSYMLPKLGESGMSKPELQETAVILIIAGSETTATFLSGEIYLILRKPKVYQRLVAEVRSAFHREEDITITAVQSLPYMNAVINETFRCYPPAPSTFPRIVPGGGEMIEGNWVPGGMTVGVNPWSAFHDSRNFHKPDEFLPERYLKDSDRTEDDLPSELFASDKFETVQPFSYGPRNCIGKNLAYAELRLITAKLLFNFDMKLAPESDNDGWIRDQKTHLIWEKLPLMVDLAVREV